MILMIRKNVTLDDESFAALKKLSGELGMNHSEYIRHLLGIESGKDGEALLAVVDRTIEEHFDAIADGLLAGGLLAKKLPMGVNRQKLLSVIMCANTELHYLREKVTAKGGD